MESRNLGGRASQVAKREIFLALIEHGPRHFLHKRSLNTHAKLFNMHLNEARPLRFKRLLGFNCATVRVV